MSQVVCKSRLINYVCGQGGVMVIIVTIIGKCT